MLKVALVDELHNLKRSGVYHSNEDVKKALTAQGAKVRIFAIKKRGRVFNKIVATPYLRDILIFPFWNYYIFSKIDRQEYDVAVIRTTNNLYLTRKTNTKKVIYTGSIQTRQLEILLRIKTPFITKLAAIILYPVVFFSEYFSLRKADAVLVSKESFSQFLNTRFRLSGPKVIPLPALSAFEAPKINRNSSKRFDIMFVGRLSIPKNWPLVLDIARRTNFSIAAVTPEALNDTGNVPENITIFSRIPRDNMVELYKESRTFLMPSFMEGSPKCTIEAMAMGLPIIASPDGGDDFVIDGENGQIIKSNESELYIKAISAYLSNSELAAQTREKNIVRAKKFDASTLGPKYYTTLLKVTQKVYNRRNDNSK